MKIAIAGKAGSGKTVAANYLKKRYGFKRRALADKLKEICSLHYYANQANERVWLDAYHEVRQQVRDLFPEFETSEWKDIADSVWEAFMAYGVVDGKSRSLLQHVGTDIFREYSGTVWVDHILRTTTDDSRVVVDDVRFKDEFHILQQDGWTMVYCAAPDDIRASRLKAKYGRTLTEEEANHPSEKDLDDLSVCKLDWILNTAGSIEAEEQQVRGLFHYLHTKATSSLWPPWDKQV